MTFAGHPLAGRRGEPIVSFAAFCYQLGRGYFAQTSPRREVLGLLVAELGTADVIAQLTMGSSPLLGLKTKLEN
jgi:hypothetical protein